MGEEVEGAQRTEREGSEWHHPIHAAEVMCVRLCVHVISREAGMCLSLSQPTCVSIQTCG